jgi:hypothetical protein
MQFFLLSGIATSPALLFLLSIVLIWGGILSFQRVDFSIFMKNWNVDGYCIEFEYHFWLYGCFNRIYSRDP